MKNKNKKMKKKKFDMKTQPCVDNQDTSPAIIVACVIGQIRSHDYEEPCVPFTRTTLQCAMQLKNIQGMYARLGVRPVLRMNAGGN